MSFYSVSLLLTELVIFGGKELRTLCNLYIWTLWISLTNKQLIIIINLFKLEKLWNHFRWRTKRRENVKKEMRRENGRKKVGERGEWSRLIWKKIDKRHLCLCFVRVTLILFEVFSPQMVPPNCCFNCWSFLVIVMKESKKRYLFLLGWSPSLSLFPSHSKMKEVKCVFKRNVRLNRFGVWYSLHPSVIHF